MTRVWDAVVIGGGAAGLSAALMLGRSRRSVLVLDAGEPRNRFAAHMHGVLGQEGVDPATVLAGARAEVTGYGVEVATARVARVEEMPDGVRVVESAGPVHRARALVLASGMTDRLPEVPGLAERWGSTVLHCPYCHGWEVRGGRLGVLTTSPLGLHQAELVRQWSDRLVVFTAGLGPIDPGTAARLRARDVPLVASPVVEVASATDGLAVHTADGGVREIDALFTVGTAIPHDDAVAHLGLARRATPMGPVIAVDAMGRTSHPRIWAAGNVVDPSANVPLSIGTGSFVGAAVNAALVTEDFDLAARASSAVGP